jgi:hypothetical protein
LNREQILSAVENQLLSFRIFVAEVSDKRIRERIEASIMLNIYHSKEAWSDLPDRGMFLKGRYNSEIPILLQDHSEHLIYGLDHEMEV